MDVASIQLAVTDVPVLMVMKSSVKLEHVKVSIDINSMLLMVYHTITKFLMSVAFLF